MKTVQIKHSLGIYQINIGHKLLADCGNWAKSTLEKNTKKIAFISNKKVYGLYGENVKISLENAGFKVFTHLIGDGERFKNFRTLEKTLKFLSEHKFSRTDAIIALGGGVVGDLTGFAASIYLRGIPFLQIPTTLLAMIDSSVGGKTAVNTEFGKNLIGTFYQPNGVLIDAETLKTLPRKELVAGFCEAIKHGAISNQKLFDEVSIFLKENPLNRFKTTDIHFKQLENLLANQVGFKAEIVANDEKEDVFRNDFRSRKILNFGHTTAHALEKITDYRRFKHGEAVGLGILVAAEISKRLDFFDKHSLQLLNDVVGLLGKMPKTDDIDLNQLIENFAFDKKMVGNSLKWILLNGIGKPVIIENKQIPTNILFESIQTVLNKSK
ncbi:MAG: 3-dehydroquinate synthase [Pyrinomonadaceae bacterium]|jgi:3-dehydroquinate synthase|nr:3-dehydroquinate synthase [Pyrinomonadaceae bacterium]